VVSAWSQIINFIWLTGAFRRFIPERWAKDNTEPIAADLAPSIGIPAAILAVALRRQSYGVQALDDSEITYQQKVADIFLKLGLIPKPIIVREAVRQPGT
jgi:sulfonate transport system substrate-binding protein